MMAASGPGQPPFLGISLKMYFDLQATQTWVDRVAELATASEPVLSGRVDLAVLPTFVALPAVAERALDAGIAVGAQDLAWADSGAYTGEVSGADLAALGCTLVEIGHAERRRWFAEDDTIIAAKTAAAQRNGLTPILCVGELEPGDPAAAGRVCGDQIRAALSELAAPLPELIVAYEPVWAIGADRPADADHIRTVCRTIRSELPEVPTAEDGSGGRRCRVIYGGSAGPGILHDLGDAVDGLFLGRFAHDPEALGEIITEADIVAGGMQRR